MTRRSATTHITAPREGKGMIEAAEATRAEAVARLGSDDIAVVGFQEIEDDRVAVTWRREWDEEEPAAAERPTPPHPLRGRDV